MTYGMIYYYENYFYTVLIFILVEVIAIVSLE